MFSKEEIKSYDKLSDLDKKKFQKKAHSNDLNYLASYAIESGQINLIDIEELKSRIDAGSGPGYNKNYLNAFVAMVCGIFIGATVFFGWNESKKNHESHYESFNSLPETPVKEEPTTLANTTVAEDQKSEYHKEHFSISHSAEMLLNEIELPETIESKSVTTLNQNTNENGISTENEEINLRYLPNAPVIYIKDLKVANYNLYYFKNNHTIDLQNGLSAEFSNKYERENGVMTKNPDNNYYAHVMIKDAITYFSNRNYNASVGLLDLLYKYNPKDVNCQFYIAMSYYYLGNYNRAILFFDEVLDNDLNIFEQEAEFYKAVCLNNTGQKEETKTQLRSIAERKGFYAERANELLKKQE